MRFLTIVFAAVLIAGTSCAPDDAPLLPADSGTTAPLGTQRTLIARFVHVTDTHAIDTLSPARWAGAHEFTQSAWRPWEAYSTQLLDGIVRQTNRMHAAGTTVDFLLHTGDACDNAQTNEFGWLLDIMEGRPLNSLSGPDDRAPEDRPAPALDPYAAFQPQGLYRSGVHGPAASIPWYALIGNHDTYAIGVFPIVDTHDGSRVCPLPLSGRPGLLLPTIWDPVGSLAWGNVTPANPGPPDLLDLPSFVVPNPDRRCIRKPEIIQALLATETLPAGHGFADDVNSTCYSVSPVPGLRLIGLDTTDVPDPITGLPYQDGCINRPQADWLRGELEAARSRSETVIVATHHPSNTLIPSYGTALDPQQFRDLLNSYPNVVLHICGHLHRNRVAQRGGYVEIETCSTIDPPQEARVVELWRDDADGSIVIAFRTFSDLDETYPPLGDDPLRSLRAEAHRIANEEAGRTLFQRELSTVDGPPAGRPSDRNGEIRLKR